MSYWKESFEHKPEFRIIICKSCEYAVVPVQVERHIRDHHPHTTRERRQQITQSIHGLHDVAHQYGDVVYPAPHDSPVPGLPVYFDGLQCHTCGYVCRTVRCIQSHCQKSHGWVNGQRRGGNARQKSMHSHNRMWNVGVACQRFFEFRQWQKLFAVQPQVVPLSPRSKDARIVVANQVVNDIEAELAVKRAEHRIEGTSLRCVTNPWLDFVGWHRHLAGFRVKDLIPMTWPARTEKDFDEAAHESQDSIYSESAEADLSRACQATKRMIRAAFAIADVRHVGRAAMEAVNRRELGTDSNERPFYSRLKVNSLRKYTQVWVKILRYIWRTADTDDAPLYKMTETQQRALEQFRRACQKDEAETPSEAIERQGRAEEMSATFWVRMFDHELKDDEFESGIISGLAVLGLDDAGGWKPALVYTPCLSAVVTSMRAIVVYRAFHIRQQAIARAVRDGHREDEAEAQAPSVVDGVDALVKRFMTLREFGGRISPMDRVFHQRTYGMRIRFTTKAEGRITWQGDRLGIDRVSFSMDDVRSVVHGLEETVRQGLTALLMIGQSDAMPTFHMGTLFDNPAELSTGWSFLQDARTDWAVDGHRWMWKRMFHEEHVGTRFMQSYGEVISSLDDIRWKEAGIESYFRAVRRWKEELMVLVHLSAGAPARASELISIQHKNGPEAKAQRGIFIENRMMAFVTTYHKGYSASGKFKTIHRFVPDEVAESVVRFLWLVQPFVEQLQFVSQQQTDEPSSFLWEPEPEEEWDVGEDAEMEDELHGEDGVADDGDEDEHSRPMKPEAAAKNVDGFWSSDRVRRTMHRETEKRIGVKIGTAMWRQAYPAIQRQYSVDANVKSMIDQMYDGKQANDGGRSIAETRAEQSGHGIDMEDNIYGVLMTESPFTTMHVREQFRQVSMDWHRMLHFRSAWKDESRCPKQIKEQIESARQEAGHRRWKQMRSVDIDVQLRRMTNDDAAEFRGVQREGLQAIVGGMPRVTIVMRTGGGKSMFFMIPAAGSQDGVTIVIVPVVSLRQDLVDRCEKAGIPVAAWDGSRPPYHARIVFTTPESALTLAFGRFIDEKRVTHQLERIVIDECHTVLEATPTFRSGMWRLHEMAQKGVQVVYLTATLPPTDETAWLGYMGVERSDMHFIRDVTTRPNIAYTVQAYDIEDEEASVRTLVQAKLAQYPDGQVIVYAGSIAKVKAIAEYTDGQAFFRHIGTTEEKARIVRRLTGGESRLFVATNALGLGVDAAQVRCVIHVGSPKEMKRYAQESGRAGRDGSSSEAIIMRGYKTDDRGTRRPDGEWKMEHAMEEFLEGKSCRRMVYDRQMDGRTDRQGCESGEERCDVCEAQGSATQRRRTAIAGEKPATDATIVTETGSSDDFDGSTLVEDESPTKEQMMEVQRQREDQAVAAYRAKISGMEQRARRRIVCGHVRAERFASLLQQWQGRCSICVACGRSEDGRHRDWRQCPQVEHRKQVQRRWESFRRIRYKYSACFRCHAPQAVCHWWQAKGGAQSGRYERVQGKTCQSIDVVRDIAAAVWALGGEGSVRIWLREQMGVQGIDVGADKENDGEEAMMEWFGQRFVEGGMEVSGLCKMVWEFGQVEAVGNDAEF